MKKIDRNKPSFQGDLMIIPIDVEIPSDVPEVQANGEYHVVAHSETGHHHVVAARKVRVFAATAAAMSLYLKVQKQALLEHQRPHDTHEALSLPPGNYQLLRQREGTPQGWRLVAD